MVILGVIGCLNSWMKGLVLVGLCVVGLGSAFRGLVRLLP